MVEGDVWRWIWTILCLVLLGGELITAGFFLLPFGVGAGLAAVAAWVGLNVGLQWAIFFVGTGLAFLAVRRFMVRQDSDDDLKIGPERYIGRQGLVLEKVDMEANTGRVRVEAEEWRAITDGGPIPEGATVEIVEPRGTRLVVVPADNPGPSS